MGYQVVLSPSARHDLREIVRYISLDDPTRASNFGQFLLDQAKKLAGFPEMGRVVPEFAEEGLREIVVRVYRVIYRVSHQQRRVEVLRFWHGARGTPRMTAP